MVKLMKLYTVLIESQWFERLKVIFFPLAIVKPKFATIFNPRNISSDCIIVQEMITYSSNGKTENIYVSSIPKFKGKKTTNKQKTKTR